MRRLLNALTTRGRSFVAAGGAAAGCGLLIPEPDLLRIGALLMVLPLLSGSGPAGPGTGCPARAGSLRRGCPPASPRS